MGFDLIAAIDWQETANTTLNILKVALGLGFVIFVHELGHFVVAKLCGVKCEKFYIGFDIPMPFGIPSKLYRVQWGETEYGIGILPLGGYVKMLGQDDNPLNAEQEAERTKLSTDQVAATTGAETTPVAKKSALDPRSYTAKTVSQRMAIISAGVIVNLIFAVIFATIAYSRGVPIMPCEIGQVIPGGPAWKAGLQANTRIVQIGENGKKSPNLRFDWDLRQSVGLHGDQVDLPLLVRDASGRETIINIRPVTFQRGWEKLSSIGITPEHTMELHYERRATPTIEGSSADQASPKLQNHDLVIAVDGQSVSDHHDLTAYLAQQVDKPVTLRVERKPEKKGDVAQTFDIQVPAQHRRTIGAIMEYGPITAIRPDSPAARAGFREGDILKTINDEPLGDPMMLPHQLRPWHGKEIEIGVLRSNVPDLVKIRVTPETPKTFDWDWAAMPRAPMSTEALGVAFTVSSVIKEVQVDSPAAKAGLLAGDKLVSMVTQWRESDSKRDKSELLTGGESHKIDNDLVTWSVVTQLLQHVSPDESVTFEYQRGNSAGKATVIPVDSEAFQPDRGLVFATRTEVHIASSFGEAVRLGLRQTWEDATRVVGLLKKLINGSVSPTNLGGIGSIAYVASNEASEGLPRLLIFLTMLSANLAVLNFLPIPALDGGHMMFLIYEGLFRKPVSERVQVALTIFGVVCLLGLMIFVNALDVRRFLFKF